MSHRIHNTEAFVLSGTSRAEGSSYVRFYTRELGLISAWVQGSRALQSKLRYHVQPFSYTRLSLVRGRDMWRVVGAEEIAILSQPLKSLERFQFLSKIFTLISRLVTGEEADSDLFDEVRDALIKTEHSIPESDLKTLEVLTVLRVLFRLGYLEATSDAKTLLSVDLADISQYEEARLLRGKAVSLINIALRASQL